MSTYTTPAQDAATIRAELKRRGWGSRDISVRAQSYSMGSNIHVTIRRPGIPFAEVNELARGTAEHIRYDGFGEILSGGNRFVDVRLDEDALRPIRDALLPRVQAWPVGPYGRPFVAGAVLWHEKEHGPDAYAVSYPGREDGRLRPCWDADCAADLVARRLFQFPDALAIAQHVGQVQP